MFLPNYYANLQQELGYANVSQDKILCV